LQTGIEGPELGPRLNATAMTGPNEGPDHGGSKPAWRTSQLLALLIFALIVLVMVRVFFG
jgi:hypothetical protein